MSLLAANDAVLDLAINGFGQAFNGTTDLSRVTAHKDEGGKEEASHSNGSVHPTAVCRDQGIDNVVVTLVSVSNVAPVDGANNDEDEGNKVEDGLAVHGVLFGTTFFFATQFGTTYIGCVGTVRNVVE